MYLPLLSLRTLFYAVRTITWRPKAAFLAMARMLRNTTGLKRCAKNIAIVPKGLAMAWVIRQLKPDHVHVHWASTPSSAAFIASEITGTPWSLTAHRWDIGEANCLSLKADSASFVRAISEKGSSQIRSRIDPRHHHKVHCIHMGSYLDKDDAFVGHMSSVEIDDRALSRILVCPANLLPVKGHVVLLDACAILMDKGIDFNCIMFGQGPLRETLEKRSRALGLSERVEWRGQIPHNDLLSLYAERRVSIVVLPSITTSDAEEGIPVSLIEAMAAGIPVVSTMTGSIPELLEGNAGLLIPQKDPGALAGAMASLLTDPELYDQLSRNGRARVQEGFDIKRTTLELLSEFCDAQDGIS